MRMISLFKLSLLIYSWPSSDSIPAQLPDAFTQHSYSTASLIYRTRWALLAATHDQLFGTSPPAGTVCVFVLHVCCSRPVYSLQQLCSITQGFILSCLCATKEPAPPTNQSGAVQCIMELDFLLSQSQCNCFFLILSMFSSSRQIATLNSALHWNAATACHTSSCTS